MSNLNLGIYNLQNLEDTELLLKGGGACLGWLVGEAIWSVMSRWRLPLLVELAAKAPPGFQAGFGAGPDLLAPA